MTFTIKPTRLGDLILAFDAQLKRERETHTSVALRQARVPLEGQPMPRHPSGAPYELVMPQRESRDVVDLAHVTPARRIVQRPPYDGASEDETRGIPNVLTRKEHGNPQTGQAETWALTFDGDPTADRLGIFYVHAAAVWLFEEVTVPSRSTSLIVNAPVSFEGTIMRWIGNIYEPQPQPPTNRAGMSVFSRVDAWSPEWPRAVRGPQKTIANRPLGVEVGADSINVATEVQLRLDDLQEDQQIIIGVALTAFAIAEPPPNSGVQGNVSALAAGYWLVPSMTFRFF